MTRASDCEYDCEYDYDYEYDYHYEYDSDSWKLPC